MSGDGFDHFDQDDNESEDPREQILKRRAFAGPAEPVPVGGEDEGRTINLAPPPRRTADAPSPGRVVERTAPVAPAPAHYETTDGLVGTTSTGGPRARGETREGPSSTGGFGGRPRAAGTGFGRQVGGQRAVGLYLDRVLRERLDARRRAGGETRGALLITALRHSYSTLTELVLADGGTRGDAEADDVFGPVPRSPRRVADGAMVTFYVSEAQAYALAQFATRLGLSVSAVGSRALVTWLDSEPGFTSAGD